MNGEFFPLQFDKFFVFCNFDRFFAKSHNCMYVYVLFISSLPLYSLGVINVVTSTHGNASEVGQAFCESPDVAALSFTGSTRVGKASFHIIKYAFASICLSFV